MNTNEENRRPDQIEDDIERKRAEVSSTIDAIQSKLSPGEMMDEALQYLRNNGAAEFGKNLGRSVRDNPVPIALIGVGVAWLMMSGGRDRRSDWDDYPAIRTGSSSRYHTDEADLSGEWASSGSTRSASLAEPGLASRIGSAGSSAGESVRDSVTGAAKSVGDTVSGAASRVGEKVSSAASRVREKVSGATGRARGMASGASGRLGGLKDDVRARVTALPDVTRQRANRMLDDQPLVLGAVGIAIGAAIGAALPTTRREDELMGEMRDQLLESAKSGASEQMDSVKESAQRVAQTARDEIERVIESPTTPPPSASDDPTRPASTH